MFFSTSCLVNLEGEHNFDDWEHHIEVELDCRGFTDYVFGTVAEPNEEAQPEAHENWFIQRAITMRMLLSTLKNRDVITTLICNGWDRWNRNPKVLYDLVQSYVGHVVTNETRR